jgi:hypothetical protein
MVKLASVAIPKYARIISCLTKVAEGSEHLKIAETVPDFITKLQNGEFDKPLGVDPAISGMIIY